MSVLGLISGLISIVNAIIGYYQQKKLIDDALAVRLSLNLTKAKAEILDAQGIRDTVDRRTPEQLRDSADGLFRD